MSPRSWRALVSAVVAVALVEGGAYALTGGPTRALPLADWPAAGAVGVVVFVAVLAGAQWLDPRA